MSKQDDLVRIVTEVSKECRKQLRILAIQKETTLSGVVRDVLERAMRTCYEKKTKTISTDPTE